MEVNSLAHMWLAKRFLPPMIKKNQGHIVTIASAAGLVGTAGLADYAASKFAAIGFDEAIRFELRNLGKAASGVKTTGETKVTHFLSLSLSLCLCVSAPSLPLLGHPAFFYIATNLTLCLSPLIVVAPFYTNTGMFTGVKTKVNWLLPILDPTLVVSKIIEAVKKDKAVLYIPKLLHAAVAVKAISPRVGDWLVNLLGISSSMDDFKGRGTQWALGSDLVRTSSSLFPTPSRIPSRL
jgi:all-trans-retinol dehydrogenase (NAD+)